jgi:hypothetical protein
MTFQLVENNDYKPSVTALDDTEHVLAGAYYDQHVWRLYVTESVMPPAQLPFTPKHAFALTKDDAVWFVQILAHWYSERKTA